jgi:hypothetical protein
MKTKVSFIIAVAVLALVGISTTSYAFHDGGTAYCEGCHTMHNSFQSTSMIVVGGAADPNASNTYLLKGADQSSTCLYCHGKGSSLSSYHVSTQSITPNLANGLPQQMTPGGDFSWVKIRYKTAATSGSGTGERHGHNIVATDYSYFADATNTKAPGATTTYLASGLNCISCHDPHSDARRDINGDIVHRTSTGTFPTIEASGSYGGAVTGANYAVGVYRFLGGVGYAPKSNPSVPFVNETPLAVVPSTYNRGEDTAETHVAYGSGMSEWCANCHQSMLSQSYASGTPAHPHPAGSIITNATILSNYNAYVKSGDMSGVGGGYSSLVPVEEGAGATYATLATSATNTPGASTYGTAQAGAVVMCLSCHRAHATAFDSMIRWYNSDAFITEDAAYFTSGNGNAPNTTAQVQKGYNDRSTTHFADFQRVLCNKCHAKD